LVDAKKTTTLRKRLLPLMVFSMIASIAHAGGMTVPPSSTVGSFQNLTAAPSIQSPLSPIDQSIRAAAFDAFPPAPRLEVPASPLVGQLLTESFEERQRMDVLPVPIAFLAFGVGLVGTASYRRARRRSR